MPVALLSHQHHKKKKNANKHTHKNIIRWVMTYPTKADDLISIPRTYVAERNDHCSCPLIFTHVLDLHTHTQIHKQIQKAATLLKA